MSGLRLTLTLLLVLLTLAGTPAASAGEPSRLPMLRVETGMHTTLIRRIVVDAARDRLITAGDDKTIRIWQMPQLRLIATLRVPMDSGHEGQLFGLALSPDGKTLAAGGWTGWDWDGTASVYLLDTTSGELIRRIGGFRDAIHALAWSPDGKHLAVGLQGRAGLDVVQIADGQVIARDTQYRDKLTDMDFDRGGRLATVSLDGMTRLYDSSFKILGRRVVPGGSKPISVRFSPDASKIAIGFVDTAAVSVVSGVNLNFLFSPPSLPLKDQKAILSVVWSSDGKTLYAAGDYGGTGKNPVYRWSEGGTGPLQQTLVANNRIPELQQMPGNRIAFAAEDPGFGVLGPADKMNFFRGPDIIDFNDAHGRLHVSPDGALIHYPSAPGLPLNRSFLALGHGDQVPTSTPSALVLPPILQAPGLDVVGWKNTYAPRINGKAPQLDDYEMARSYAIAPDRKHVLLGTEWAVRLFDQEARQLWAVKLPAVAWAVNVSLSGKLALAALSDGTIRWYRMQDGVEVFAYFQHKNDRDWISWLPDGHYISSVFGDTFVGWHVNRGKEQTPDFLRAVQFDRILYRPDVVHDGFRAAIDSGVRQAAPRYDIARIGEIAPPRLQLRVDDIDKLSGRANVRLQIKGDRGATATRDIAVFVNGIPITPARERHLSEAESGGFTRQISLPLSMRENDIRVEAFNGLSMGVAETYIALPDEMTIAKVSGNLYLLAIGVNGFPALPAETELAYAARDAEVMSQTLLTNATPFFKQAFIRVISDNTAEKPGKKVIMDALDFVQQAEAADTAIIFLASHGVSDKAGNYYFVPRDVKATDLSRLAKGGEPENLISWSTFFDSLRNTAGRRLLIVDTCHARGIEGKFESHSLLKRSAASLFSLMLASKSEEKSQEHDEGKHGLFTYSLLSAMVRESDTDQDGMLSQRELFEAARLIMETNRDKEAGPQTPQLIAPGTLAEQPMFKLRDAR